MDDNFDLVLRFTLVWGAGVLVVTAISVALFLYVRRRSLSDD